MAQALRIVILNTVASTRDRLVRTQTSKIGNPIFPCIKHDYFCSKLLHFHAGSTLNTIYYLYSENR